jgi:hypothetical protein
MLPKMTKQSEVAGALLISTGLSGKCRRAFPAVVIWKRRFDISSVTLCRRFSYGVSLNK